MTESDLPVVQLTPGRWGDPAQTVEVPEAALAALKHLGVRRTGVAVEAEQVVDGEARGLWSSYSVSSM